MSRLWRGVGEVGHQLAGRHAKPVRQGQQGHQPRFVLSALEPSDDRASHARAFAEAVLREAFSLAEFAQTAAESGG